MPGLSPGEATGSRREVVSGMTPAQVSISASAVSSSSGGPDLRFTDASPIGMARIAVALSSRRLGPRTSLQRPGSSFSVKAFKATNRSAVPETDANRPKAMTDSYFALCSKTERARTSPSTIVTVTPAGAPPASVRSARLAVEP